MAGIEDGQPPFALEAVAILREQRVAVEDADTAAVIFGLRQRVANQHRESPIEPSRELCRDRVVLGLRDVADLLDLGELGIGPTRLKVARPRGHFVGIEHPFEPLAA